MTHGPVGDSASGLDYEESEHSGRVVRIASVAALGGLLFGYDSAVINGAVAAVQDEFGIDNTTLGFAVASALLGAAAGAMTAGRLADKIGRLSVMWCCAANIASDTRVFTLSPLLAPELVNPAATLSRQLPFRQRLPVCSANA